MAQVKRPKLFNICAFLIALISWGVGWLLAEVFHVRSWDNLLMLCFNDFIFICIIAYIKIIKIDRYRRRYMCSILSIAFFYIALFSPVSYIYEYSNYIFISPIYHHMLNGFKDLSLVLSLLLIVVSITPQGILNAMDRRLWPNWAGNIFNYSGKSGLDDLEESS